jgi:hypothetical protein
MKNYEFMKNSMKKSMQRELKLAVGIYELYYLKSHNVKHMFINH